MSMSSEAELLDQINSVFARIDGKTTELQDAITGRLHWLPGGLRDKVVDGWNTFCGFMRRIWDNLNEVVSNMGSVSALSEAANRWSDLVGGPVSGQVQSADAGLLTVDTHWDGDAADAYRQTLPMQKAALDKVKSALTDGIASALGAVSTALIMYWGLLVTALATLIGGIVGGLASSATIIGLPAGPFIAAAGALAACAQMITGSEVLKAACSSAGIGLRLKLDDNAAFPGGHWPPAATAG
jgi:hypothetical protein